MNEPQHCDACDDPDCQGFDTPAIRDHPYRPDRAGQWHTGRCDKCGEPQAAHFRCTCGEAWRGHPSPHAATCPKHVR